jgi:cobalt/nickel transport protein
MPKRLIITTAAGYAMCCATAFAHFGMIIPDDNMVSQDDGRAVALQLSFSHPFELGGMVLDHPATFTVTHEGETTDLLGDLVPAQVMEQPGYAIDYELERPGTYVFAMEPQAYWEPAEDSFITHYTKTYVSAFDDDTGWNAELGLRTEIVPLSKPFGLWQGNVFQGIVKLEGEPVPYAEVEVEFYNREGTAAVPSDLMITQTVKADGNGVFTYATPAAGWWGFAALSTAPETIAQDGSEKALELGAVIWVHFEAWVKP